MANNNNRQGGGGGNNGPMNEHVEFTVKVCKTETDFVVMFFFGSAAFYVESSTDSTWCGDWIDKPKTFDFWLHARFVLSPWWKAYD